MKPRRSWRVFAGAAVALVVLIVTINRPAEPDPASRVYGMMIDAGSTGSRMHTFVFSKGGGGENDSGGGGGPLTFVDEDFFPITPGLSAYKDDPKQAAAAVETLLRRAREVIPEAAHGASPVFLRATAGLRMLGEDKAGEILREVRATLRKSGFRFDADEWVSILGGNDEGIYSWITVNYMLESEPSNTVGTLEMGGGSAQVAFVPRGDLAAGCKVPLEKVQYKGANLSLYTTSHLGYGLKKATATVMSGLSANASAANPCLPVGATSVRIPFEDTTLRASGAGDFGQCVKEISTRMSAGAGACQCGVCTYGGAAQPPPIGHFVAFAFYKERTAEVGLASTVTMEDVERKGREICGLGAEEVRRAYPSVANGEAVDLCFDLAFIYAHLRDGHGITPDRGTRLDVVSKIKGVELGWSLGAMFAELDRLGIA